MTESNNQNKTDDTKQTDQVKQPQDLAHKFFADALRASFILLQIIMAVIILLFIVSGWKEIGSDENALVLSFGKRRGLGEKRILPSGGTWIWPYPIEGYLERDIPDNSRRKRKTFGPKLNPLLEGYSLTRSEKQQLTDSPESDYNIVHTKWQLTYQIDNPELFFNNVFIDWENIEPGQNYSDVITGSITQMLKALFGNSVITTLVNYTIDDVLFDRIGTITGKVEKQLQQKLDDTQCGIKVVSVQLDGKAPPRQVNHAFQALIRASSSRETEIAKAKTQADKTINQAKGQSAEIIANAKAFRKQVVESAEANAEFFKQMLPEYRKNPMLVIRDRYRLSIRSILENVDEKIVIQPSKTEKPSEIRIELNRDPKIKKKK